MSLRSKIIWLFVGLAVLPVLALGAFGYWHALRLMEGTVIETLRASASEVEQGLRAGLAEVRDTGATAPSCGRHGGSESSIVSEDIPVTAGSGPFSAGIRLSALIDRGTIQGSHVIRVMDTSDGSMLYSDRCEELNDRPSALFGLWADAGSDTTAEGEEFTYRSGGERHFAVSRGVPGTSWRVVASTSPSELFLPLGRLHLTYWAFVLVLALSTVLAFSMLLGRVTRSLRDLTRAAENIGNGDLDPWLPVPTGGEVGRLTEAFSRMLERIRQMMAQVNQNGRLAVVGQMSAYLAHEIRNPLSSIKLNLQRLHRWSKAGELPDFCMEPVEISLKEVDRLTAAVSGVLQLSRSQDSPRELLNLHTIVQEAADLILERADRQGVDLRLDLSADTDLILGRPGQLKGVVLNLMVNALEAQPDGGSLEVESQLVAGRAGEGPLIAVRFRDGGPGVPPAIQDRVFEPFFTTKKKGSGIGLAVAAQSVQENRGRLYLQDPLEAASGAEFVVAFPLASTVPPERKGDEPPTPGWVHDVPAWPVRRRTDCRGPESGRVPGPGRGGSPASASSALAPDGSEEVT
jgi:signal transduction histidine kinase